MKSFIYMPVGLICLLLAGCGGGETTSAPASSPEQITAPKIETVKAERTPMERGRILYKRCQACHTLEDGGKHKVGPNLWNVYGSKAGTKEGYAYSKALLASEIVWDNSNMDAYMERPREFIPGNKMSFIGIKKQEDRDALQIYIKAQTGAE